MADKNTDGISAVSLPAGSFDTAELGKALETANAKPEGEERDQAIADAIASTNHLKIQDAVEPGYEYVKRGSLYPKDDPRSSDALADEMVKVYKPKLLEKQVKDGVVDQSALDPPAVVATDPAIAPAPVGGK